MYSCCTPLPVLPFLSLTFQHSAQAALCLNMALLTSWGAKHTQFIHQICSQQAPMALSKLCTARDNVCAQQLQAIPRHSDMQHCQHIWSAGKGPYRACFVALPLALLYHRPLHHHCLLHLRPCHVQPLHVHVPACLCHPQYANALLPHGRQLLLCLLSRRHLMPPAA
jgi:hypothetical protein